MRHRTRLLREGSKGSEGVDCPSDNAYKISVTCYTVMPLKLEVPSKLVAYFLVVWGHSLEFQ